VFCTVPPVPVPIAPELCEAALIKPVWYAPIELTTKAEATFRNVPVTLRLLETVVFAPPNVALDNVKLLLVFTMLAGILAYANVPLVILSAFNDVREAPLPKKPAAVIFALPTEFAREINAVVCVVVPLPIVNEPVLARVIVGEVVELPTKTMPVLLATILAPTVCEAAFILPE
jgi:hypothetical protein